jgi:hypothetical protein
MRELNEWSTTLKTMSCSWMDLREAGVDSAVVMDFNAVVGSSHGSDGRHLLALQVLFV